MIPVHIIGLGMSPQDLTAKAQKLIQAAAVLAGGRRQLSYFPSHPGEKITLGKDLDQALAAIREAAQSKQVVVLASGDPYYYGIGARLTEWLGPGQVIVHPNITAVQKACSLLKIPWDDATVLSLHGRSLDTLREVLGRAAKIIIYTAGAATPAAIARLLQTAPGPSYRMCVLENLGEASQRITWPTLAETVARTFSPLNLVVLLQEPEDAGVTDPLHLGLPETALDHTAGLITKTEIRAVVLAKLRLLPGLVLWDVGAGCGSVGLEASLLLPGGRVLAVEQQEERARQIANNCRRYRAWNLEVVCGSAPQCLADLEPPDRVFIGGGGKHLPAILEVVAATLRPGGRVVLTASLLATLTTAVNRFQAMGWQVDLTQVQVSRSRTLSDSFYLQALNPVWIITAMPQESPT